MKPPTVRPMTTQTRQRIRRRILDQASGLDHARRRHRSHGWVPAVVAVAGVVAIAMAATQLIGPSGRVLDSGPAASTTSSPASSPVSPVNPVNPESDANVIDRGAPSAAQLSAAKNWCLRNQDAAGNAVVFARRVLWTPGPRLSPSIVTAALIRTTDGKHRACFHDVSHHLVSSLPTPTATDPVKRFAVSGSASLYRLHPSVARLETRLSWPKGRTYDWSLAVISNGIAYGLDITDVPPLQNGTPVPPQLDLRAFDAAGRPIPM